MLPGLLERSIRNVIEETLQNNDETTITQLIEEHEKHYHILIKQISTATRSDLEALNQQKNKTYMFKHAYKAALAKQQRNQELYENHVQQAINIK